MRSAVRALLARVVTFVLPVLVLTTCTADSPLGIHRSVRAMLDATALFQAGGAFPITIDAVDVTITKTSDGALVLSQTLTSADFQVSGGQITIPLDIQLDESPEDVDVLVVARQGATEYYRASTSVTVTAGATVTTSPLTPTYTGPGANADGITFSLDTIVQGGDSVLLSATARQGATVIPGVPVAFTSSDSNSVRVRRSTGQALDRAWAVVLSAGTASVTITATLPNAAGTNGSGTVAYVRRATQIVKISGDAQSLNPSSSSLPLVVEVRDGSGTAFVSGTTVTFARTAGPTGSSIAPTTVVTDGQGRASTVITAGTATGAVTVTASAGHGATPLAGSPLSFAATIATATGPAANVTANSAVTQSATVNTLVAAPPSVKVTDASSNPVSGVNVVFAVASGGGALTAPTTVVTNAAGIATSAGWTLGQTAGANTVTATVATLTPVTFTGTGLAGAAASVAKVSGDAQTGAAASPLALPLVVVVKDAFGNNVSGATVNWATTSGGSLAPASGPTAANGQAQSAWTLGPTAPTQTATATVGALTPASFSATATFGPPAITLSFPGTVDVGVGHAVLVRATLSTPAGAGGVTVTLTSDNTQFVTVSAPGTIVIPQGQSFGERSVNGVAIGSTTLRGNATGFTEGTLSINVLTRAISVQTPISVPYGGTASIPINIGQAAPAGGVVVSLSSSQPTLVGLQSPTVTIPQGLTTASATVLGLLPGVSSVTASNVDFDSDVSQVTTSAKLNIVQGSLTINASFGSPIDIQFTSQGAGIAAPAPGITVNFTSLDPTCVAAPAPATIATGLVATTAPLVYGGTATLACNTRIIASATNIDPDTVLVGVNPVPAITSNNVTVGAGLMVPVSANLGASNHGGTTVHIASSNQAQLRVSKDALTAGTASIDIPIADGNSSFSYYVHGVEGQVGNATVTLSAPSFTSGTAPDSIAAPSLDVIFLPATTTTFSPNSGFNVRLGVPNAANTAMAAEQVVRAGSPGLTATVQTTDAAVGNLVGLSQNGLTVTTVIAANSSRNPSGAAAGGVDFHPVGPGTVPVSATIPGFTVIPTATSSITVSAPTITSNVLTVGAGLEVSTSANLGASNHGGVTVTLTSSDPARLLLSPDGVQAGTGIITIPILNGNAGFSYYVQGVEGQEGAVRPTVTISAPGFNSAVLADSIAPPSLDVIFLPGTTTSLSPNSGFQARLGTPSGTTGLSAEQVVRAGAPGPVVVTLTLGTPGVAQLVTTANTAQTVTVNIAAGQSRSPGSVATGGVEFDPVAPGTTTVVGSSPGYAVVNSATQTVTVTGASVNLNAITVGGGLQVGTSGSLGASNHGGVTVHIQSNDPTRLLLAHNSTSAGQDTIDIAIPNGSTGFSYTAMGLEGQVGPVSVTASAPGFSPVTAGDSVAPVGLDIIFLPTSTTTFSPNSAFQIRIGTVNNATPTPQLTAEQSIRFGGPTLIATVTSSVPTVARLAGVDTGQTTTTTIPTGQSRSPGSVATGGVELDPLIGGTTTISATAPGYASTTNATIPVTVSAPGIGLSSVTVGAGLIVGTNGNLGASNHGGTVVTLTTSNPAVAVLSHDAATPGQDTLQIAIPNNQSGFSYFVQGIENATGTVAVTAQAPGFTDGSMTATVVPPGFDVIFLQTSVNTATPNFNFQVRTGTVNSNNTALSAEQSIRPGGATRTATITSSNPAVGPVITAADSGGTAFVTLAAGASRTGGTRATGGVEFDPQAAGTTTISATMPGFVATTNTASQVVTVSPSPISMAGNNIVGAGLMYSATGNLGGSSHSPVVVHLVSSDPSLLQLSHNTSGAGQDTLDILVPNGQTSFSYTVQGVEGKVGRNLITASAPGFVSASESDSVAQAAADIIFLPTTASAAQANIVFQVRTGVPNSLSTGLQSEQSVRPGLGITATVNNTTAAVAQLVGAAGPSQSVQVAIPGGTSRSAGSAATGGVEFDPLGQGTTTVSSTIPGFFNGMPSSTVTVVVGP